VDTFTWYQSLIRPEWAPPAWLFGPAWTILYTLIVVSFGAVFYKIIKKQLPRAMAVTFLLNLFFNFIFSPIQFTLQNNLLAAVDILLVLATLIWILIVSYKKIRWVFWMNVPYVCWVTFATVLQLTVTYLNW